MKQANMDIRMAARSAGVPLWRVADEYGKCAGTIINWLRHELPEEKKKEMLDIIDRLSREE